MQLQSPLDQLALMVDDVTLALRPYGIDPSDPTTCAETLRTIADTLSPKEPRVHRAAGTIIPLIRPTGRLNRAGGPAECGPKA